MTTLAIKGIQSFARGGVKALTSLAISTATGAISRALDNRVFEGPRLESFHLQTSRDGAPLPRVFGRTRLAGQVIWASQVRETETEEAVGGKGGGPTRRDYSYTISFAVALCEGEILGVDRIWANGEILQRQNLTIRVHTGSDAQGPDPIIAATEGIDVPAFRGTAYIVFEDFPLDDYGARLPSINAEIVRGLRRGGRMEDLIQSVNLLPGTGEFALSPTIVEEIKEPGLTIASNMNSFTGQADLLTSLDQLQAELPNCRHVNIISAWFGTSLQAGLCNVLPGAENAYRNLPDAEWSVAGLRRANAYIVSSDAEGRANYGGTPSDDSLIACIQTLKQRGFRVTLYPFLLMDMPSFPWRGRIAADSVADVDAFFGTDGDFRFRHSILHHARIAQQAGGVDAIVIGTELKALTAFREEETFPAVNNLITLAADVRSIVGPQTKITYAADWSDYFGLQDGSDIRYHLDPLWADPNIDAVGIDNYFPLSDWRDGDHLDANGIRREHDLDYLQANVEGGEGYDWYYASAADRDAQIRTPITDPVYRYKDMRHWWGQPHTDRRDGLPAGQSPWVPRSKPIWLLEMGCPAVNKGANQPNVFYDPKSIDSGLPYYSDGTRDDLIQRRYIEAFLSYYTENNEPGFLDLSRASIWAWDARPYPDFPARTAVWSDGPNWARGHWLNGRVGLLPVADVIEELARDSGLTRIDVSGVSGVLPGYVVDRPMSARAALQPLLQLFNIEMGESGGIVRFSLGGPTIMTLGRETVIDGPVRFTRADPEDRIRDVRLTYLDASRDYQLGAVSARNQAAESVAVIDLAVPAMLDEGFARSVVTRELARAHAGEQTLALDLPLSRGLCLEVGDRIAFDDAIWAVETLETGTDIRITARRDHADAGVWVSGATPQTPDPVDYAAPPQLYAFDLPGQGGVTVGAQLVPFEPIRVSTNSSEGDLRLPVRIGATISPFNAGPIALRDRHNHVDILINHPGLNALEDTTFLQGGNRFAIETETGWEIFAARDIVLIAPQTYRLSHLLRGLDGSDIYMMDLCPAGARIVALNTGLVTLPLSQDWRETIVTIEGQSDRRDARSISMLWTDRNGWPLSPVHLRWDGSRLRWIGRDRQFTNWDEDDSFLRYRVRLFRGETVDLHDLDTPFFDAAPFDRAEVVQINALGRESLFPATLNVTAA